MRPRLSHSLGLSPFQLGILACLSAVLLSGCKSYQLGYPAELPFETIYVQPASNESYAPQVIAGISANLRQAILRDGRVRLVADKQKADVLLSVILTEYERDTATRDPNDTEVALDYDLTLTSEVSLYDQRSGEYLLRSVRVEERATAFLNDLYRPAGAADTQSFVQSEYQAMPRITRDLAGKISDTVLGAW